MSRVKSQTLTILALGLLGLSTSGCGAKFGDMLSLSDASKEQKLYQRIEHFNRARYWGSAQEALTFVDPRYKAPFLKDERERATNSRIVRSEVSQVDLNPDGSASVELEVQYFEQPSYIVRSRKEKQSWQFQRYSGGWLMTESELVESGNTMETDPSLSRGRMRGLGSY